MMMMMMKMMMMIGGSKGNGFLMSMKTLTNQVDVSS